MFARIFLILAGVFAGMWLSDGSGTLFNIGFAALSVLFLLLGIAAAPPSIDRDSRARLEEAYRQWLDAWVATRQASDRDRPAAEQALGSAKHMIALTANDRVIKSLQTAMTQDLTPPAVAQLVLDMRRSLRRAGVTIRPADLEALLVPATAPAPPSPRRDPGPRAATPASFLT